jgi:DNA-binding NarL/FixJ family response regulator
MRIVVADPLPLVRSGLKQALSPLSLAPEFVEAENAAELHELFSKAAKFDLCIADAALPGAKSIRDLCQLGREGAATLVLTIGDPDAPLAVAALSEGASGVLLKNSSAAVILAATQLLLAGGRYVAPDVFLSSGPPDCIGCAAGFLGTRSTHPARSRPSDLTARQRQVVDLMAEGLSNKEIARRLRLTEGTVKVHVGRILETLDVSSRMKAVAKARVLREKSPRV